MLYATGCLEVSSFMYPYTAWEDSYMHNAFENAGATLSGIETAYHALKKKGKIYGAILWGEMKMKNARCMLLSTH